MKHQTEKLPVPGCRLPSTLVFLRASRLLQYTSVLVVILDGSLDVLRRGVQAVFSDQRAEGSHLLLVESMDEMREEASAADGGESADGSGQGSTDQNDSADKQSVRESFEDDLWREDGE